jgi:hypothetical protein
VISSNYFENAKLSEDDGGPGRVFRIPSPPLSKLRGSDFYPGRTVPC